MKIKTLKNNAPTTIVRINKSELDMLSAKRMYYYMDYTKDEDGNKDIFYVLVDNRKGKKETTKFDSLKELEAAVNK